jgi:hypothetical protein
MVDDLQRTIQILLIDICTEEERVQVFDKADPLYSVLARTLTSRRDNLIVTVADLEKRPYTITQPIPLDLRGGLINKGRGTGAPRPLSTVSAAWHVRPAGVHCANKA